MMTAAYCCKPLLVCLFLALTLALVESARPFGYCFYAALELPKGASQDQIQAAYESLAKEYPPDGETLEISWKLKEAYTVLTSKTARDVYDKFGMKGFETWESSSSSDNKGAAEEDEVTPQGGVTVTVTMPDEQASGANNSDNGQADNNKSAVTTTHKISEEEVAALTNKLWGDDPRPDNYCFYAALRLHKKVDIDKIESAYKLLSAEYPADGVGTHAEINQKINEAYWILTSKEERAIYDDYGMKGFEAWEMGKSPELTKEPNDARWGLLKYYASIHNVDVESLVNLDHRISDK